MFSDTVLLKEQGWVARNWLVQSQLSAVFTVILQDIVSPRFPENPGPVLTRVGSSWPL